MADMGLEAAFGNAAMAEQIRQQIADRIAAEQRARDAAQQQFQNARLTANDKMVADEHVANMRDRRDQHAQGESAKNLEDTLKVADVIPPNTQMPDASPIAGRLRAIGQTQDVGITPEAPPDALAANPDAPPMQLRGTILNSPNPAGRMVSKLPSQKQQVALDEADAKVEAARVAAENRTNDNEQKAKDRIAQIEAAAAARPTHEPTAHYSFLPTYGEGGLPNGVAVGNTLTGELKPGQVPGGSQLKPPPGAGATAATAERMKTGLSAVSRVDQDIDAADAAGLIGPASGRLYSAFAKLGTTGDPKKDELIGRLKADLLLAKMHVDSGIGGARAAASPLLLKQWEDLAMSSSKDLLHGYTGALREDMTPTGTAPSGNAKPTAAELIKKYGGD